MEKCSLFRLEALQKTTRPNIGVISLNLPPSYKIISLTLLIFVLGLGLFIAIAEFSEKYAVPGYINADQGTISIYANKNGVISKQYVHKGQTVQKNDILFVIDTGYKSSDKKHDEEIKENLNKQKFDLQKQIAIQSKRMEAFKQLLTQNYVSQNEFLKTKEALLELNQKKHNLDLGLIQYQRENSYTIRAPIAGTLSSLIFNEGQAIQPGKPLAQIIPQNSKFIAEIYVPVAKSGFLSRGQKAIIQYDAYPHTRFGTYTALIDEIDESILTDELDQKIIKLNVPYYRIKATLTNQNVTIYGKQKKLQHGMTFTALILGPKRKVWEWILDPIYSFYGSSTL